jgi:hypothetical protein
MPREGRNRDLHERKQGQAGNDGVELIMALHVEDAYVRIEARDP